jgi:hypothetical protein
MIRLLAAKLVPGGANRQSPDQFVAYLQHEGTDTMPSGINVIAKIART